MVIIIVSLFVALVVWCAWRISRRIRHRVWLVWYIVLAVVLGVLFVGGLLLFKLNVIGSAAAMRVMGVYSLLWLLYAIAIIAAALLGRKCKWGAIAVVVAIWGVLIYGATCGRSILRVEQIEISSERLPEAFDGLRIAFFSDLHAGFLLDRYGLVEHLVDTINSYAPDIIVNGGDLVNRSADELDLRLMQILSTIRARYGVWSVLGNHDLGYYLTSDSIRQEIEIAHLKVKQNTLGWHLLGNKTEYIVIGTDSIAITGLNYPDELRRHSHAPLRTPIDYALFYPDTAHFNITVSHAPQVWSALMAQNIYADLTLSGHVHSMQSRITLGHWRWSPAALLYKHWSGLYEKQSKYLYVNDGIGYVMSQVRIGARPEVTIITLRR